MKPRLTIDVSAAFLAAVAGLASSAAAGDLNFAVADGQWNVAASWDLGRVPGAGDNAYVYGNRTARIGAYAANADYLRLGWNANGRLFQPAGLLTIATTTEIGGIAGGGTGLYEISGVGQLVTDQLYIAREVGSSMHFSSSLAMRVDSDMYLGGRAAGVFTQINGIVNIKRDLSLGNFDGGRGEYNLRSGNTSVERDVYVGWASGATGRMVIDAPGQLGINGTMYVGQFAGTPAVHGEVVNNGGLIYGGKADSRVVVQGSHARMTGGGTYNINVRYESDKKFGNIDKSVAVQFAPGVLTRSSTFNVGNALTGRSGNAAAQASLAAAALPGTRVNLSWGDAAFNQSVNYGNQIATPANFIGVEVPYKASDIPTSAALPRANVAGRVRLMQVGARRWDENNVEIAQASTTGQIRNITTSIGADVIKGKTADVFGSSDALIAAIPVAVRHQDPAFRALHGGTWNLTGNGILMGQLEPGVPDVWHGAFEDWSRAVGRRVTATTAAGPLPVANPHTTRVASIMVGYDPLGLQTDGQGRLVTAANGYGVNASPERGFVGIAPGAKLISRAWTNNATTTTDITTLAAATDPTLGAMRIINISAGFSQRVTPPTVPVPPTGDQPHERALDRIVETNGIIVTKSAGNDGTFNGGTRNLSMPAGIYNGIVVGAVQFDNAVTPTQFNIANATVAGFSSRGPTNPDSAGNQRSKPDLVAQGVGNLTAFAYERLTPVVPPPGTNQSFIRDPAYTVNDARGLYSTQQRLSQTAARANPGTSFAAPTVAGTAALMLEYEARPGRTGQGADPRVVKSILQTSADKPAGWERGMNDAGADDTSRIPLSFDWGAGLLDPVGSLTLLKAGPVANPRYILDDSWAFSSIANDDVTGIRGRDTDGNIRLLGGDAYQLTGIAPNSAITLTLNWYSHVTNTNTRQALNNLFLELYSIDAAGLWQPVPGALSNSQVDNLQHIFIPQFPAGGRVMARVYLGANLPVTLPQEPYALSWEYTAVPGPGALAMAGVFGVLACRRRRET